MRNFAGAVIVIGLWWGVAWIAYALLIVLFNGGF